MDLSAQSDSLHILSESYLFHQPYYLFSFFALDLL